MKIKKSPITHPEAIDYKNIKLIKQFTSRYGKIVARQYTHVKLVEQKAISNEIKRARFMGLLPFIK